LFVNTSCPYCHRAVNLLERNSLVYKKVVFPDGSALKEVKRAFDRETIPIIFFQRENEHSFELIGGFTDLEEFIHE